MNRLLESSDVFTRSITGLERRVSLRPLPCPFLSTRLPMTRSRQMTASRAALITGITGQDGGYLAKFLLDRNYTVYGLFARRTADTLWRLRHLGVENRVRLIDGDLTDLSSIMRAIEKA